MSSSTNITVGSLKPATHILSVTAEDSPETIEFILRRPSRAGVSRIAARKALGMRTDYGTGVVMLEDGKGIEMDAVLREYLSAAPAEFLAMDGEEPVKENGRPVLDGEKVPPELYAAIGEAALAFHATFRGVDLRFGARGGEEA